MSPHARVDNFQLQFNSELHSYHFVQEARLWLQRRGLAYRAEIRGHRKHRARGPHTHVFTDRTMHYSGKQYRTCACGLTEKLDV